MMSTAQAEEDVCTTGAEEMPFAFKWTIKDVSCELDAVSTQHLLQSSTFSTGSDDNCKATWLLELLPNSKRNMHVTLKLKTCDIAQIQGKCCVSALYNNKCVKMKENTFQLSVGKYAIKMLLVLERIYPASSGEENSDDLTIVCKGKYFLRKYTVLEVNQHPKWEEQDQLLVSDFESLLKKGLHSDVTLTCQQGQVIQAHKNILAARSPVFAAMFSHETKENKEGHVDIQDVDRDVLEKMLYFMYTGRKPENLEDVAVDMFIAADKYGLEGLKMMCEVTLARNLRIENVVEVLVLALTHSAAMLQDAAIKFFREHKNVVVESEKWEELFLSHSKIALEISKLT